MRATLSQGVCSVVCACALLVSVGACDGGDEDSGPLGAGATSGGFVDWTPAGTLPVPSYDGACRLLAGTEFKSPANPLVDDTLTLSGGSNGAVVMDLQVSSGPQQVLSVSGISLRRGKKDESFRDATPTTATQSAWGDGLSQSGTVLDGTLCFSDKITVGVDVHAQFSLILEDAAGAYHTVGGSFSLSASDISDGLVPGASLKVDLQ